MSTNVQNVPTSELAPISKSDTPLSQAIQNINAERATEQRKQDLFTDTDSLVPTKAEINADSELIAAKNESKANQHRFRSAVQSAVVQASTVHVETLPPKKFPLSCFQKCIRSAETGFQ